MEVRPIDANALVETLKDWRGDKDDLDVNDIHDVAYYQAMSRAIRLSEGAPTLDYEPVRHGEWIEDDTPFAKQRKCSICGKRDNPKTAIRGHYCWYCGAKMDGGK